MEYVLGVQFRKQVPTGIWKGTEGLLRIEGTFIGRHDIDNPQKGLHDLLQDLGIVSNDRQIREVHYTLRPPERGEASGFRITLTAL